MRKTKNGNPFALLRNAMKNWFFRNENFLLFLAFKTRYSWRYNSWITSEATLNTSQNTWVKNTNRYSKSQKCTFKLYWTATQCKAQIDRGRKNCQKRKKKKIIRESIANELHTRHDQKSNWNKWLRELLIQGSPAHIDFCLRVFVRSVTFSFRIHER